METPELASAGEAPTAMTAPRAARLLVMCDVRIMVAQPRPAGRITPPSRPAQTVCRGRDGEGSAMVRDVGQRLSVSVTFPVEVDLALAPAVATAVPPVFSLRALRRALTAAFESLTVTRAFLPGATENFAVPTFFFVLVRSVSVPVHAALAVAGQASLT